MKEASYKRPYIVQFHLYEMSRKNISGCLVLEKLGGKWVMTMKGHEISFQSDENVLKLIVMTHNCKYTKNH